MDVIVTYEQQLNRDVWWAFQEGSMHFGLTREFAEQLHSYVQAKYRELWDGVQGDGN